MSMVIDEDEIEEMLTAVISPPGVKPNVGGVDASNCQPVGAFSVS